MAARSEYEHRFDAFGSQVRLLIGATPCGLPAARLAALRVERTMLTMHTTLSRFDPSSELSLLGARAGTSTVVSPILLRAVQAAVAAAELSGGLSDPTLAAEIEKIGYHHSRAQALPADLSAGLASDPKREAAAPAPAGRWRQIVVDACRSAVTLPPGVRLDLGGSAKGMAVDMAARTLAGFPTFAVDAGGDIAHGGSTVAPRIIEIEDPFLGRAPHRFTLERGGVATSGLRTRIWSTSDGFAHHLIDPSTGGSAWTGVVQATALAPTVLEAETRAKTALLRGPVGGRDVLVRHGGMLILDGGERVSIGALALEGDRSLAS